MGAIRVPRNGLSSMFGLSKKKARDPEIAGLRHIGLIKDRKRSIYQGRDKWLKTHNFENNLSTLIQTPPFNESSRIAEKFSNKRGVILTY